MNAELVTAFEVSGPDGIVLKAEQVVGRGGTLHLLCGGTLYRLDVRTVLEWREATLLSGRRERR